MARADFFVIRSFAPVRPVSLNLKTRLAVWRSRRALAKLDARALEDIGISADEARREAHRFIWDVPATWTDR